MRPRTSSHGFPGDHGPWPVRPRRPTGHAPAVVAFQGVPGAYGHRAIEVVWGAQVRILPCVGIVDVIDALARGDAAYAVLPVHNEIVGDVPGVKAAIAEAGLAVLGSVRLPLRHALLGVPGSELDEVTTVHSHPMALAQCRAFLARHPAMRPCETFDTAGAARDVAARARPDEAAIADEGCAARYGLQLLAREVSDRPDNATHFAIVRCG